MSRQTGPDADTRATVYHRAGGCCERCGGADGPFALHHRRARGMGSTRRPETNQPGNLVLICDQCHIEVESHRHLAMRDGWLVGQHATPADVPLEVHARGWALLTDDGGYEPVDVWIVARAVCGCVESVLLPTRDRDDVATFREHFPNATVELAWPQVRCAQHPRGAA